MSEAQFQRRLLVAGSCQACESKANRRDASWQRHTTHGFRRVAWGERPKLSSLRRALTAGRGEGERLAWSCADRCDGAVGEQVAVGDGVLGYVPGRRREGDRSALKLVRHLRGARDIGAPAEPRSGAVMLGREELPNLEGVVHADGPCWGWKCDGDRLSCDFRGRGAVRCGGGGRRQRVVPELRCDRAGAYV